ncbi:MAG TPA: hypothetical protein VG204_00460 [Terriglobia bacterium]|nr:hypothetical protein [Terriglobia bacterium]
MCAAQVLVLLLLAFDSAKIPSDPGLYYVAAAGLERIEGHAVTVEHSGSKLPPIPLKGAMPFGGSNRIKAEILGDHADEAVPSTPVFYYRAARGSDDEAGAADLVLVKLKAKHGRRMFELSSSSKGDWNSSAGISLHSQIRFNDKQVTSGVYRLVPSEDLDPGEYGFYQYRGREMPGLLYDFSVE